MLFLNYCILGWVFLGVGMLGYWGLGIHRYAPARWAKACLWAVLISAFVLPCCLPHVPHLAEGLTPTQTFDYHAYNEWNVVDISDQSLLQCYQTATTSKDFCHCEIVQKSKLLVYAPSPYYNLLAWVMPWVWLGFALIGGLILARLAWTWWGLFRLIKTSAQRNIQVQNQQICLLYPTRPVPVSAVRLWRKYVFWNSSLDQLPAHEQEIILAHELAHLRGFDTWMLLGLGLLKAWGWTNPFWYWLKSEFGRVSEFVADEFAAKLATSPKAYARMLLTLKTQTPLPTGANGLATKTKSVFYQRIHRLVSPTESEKRGKNWRVGLFALLIPCAMWWVGERVLIGLETQHIALTQYQILQAAYEESGLPYYCPECFTPTHHH